MEITPIQKLDMMKELLKRSKKDSVNLVIIWSAELSGDNFGQMSQMDMFLPMIISS